MNWELRKKYGSKNRNGFYIDDYDKWDYFNKRPWEYRLRLIMAFLMLLMPICGIIGFHLVLDEMGLSLF